MKIVIDIPDEDYKFIKDLQFYHSGRRSGKTIERNVINGIKNGKPLPKGHGRLIDADEYKEHLYACETNGRPLHMMELNERLATVDDAPTIIEADKEKENEQTTN